MNSIEWAKYELEDVVDKSPFERMLSSVAVLTNLLSAYQTRPIIVGDLAVEIYTRSGYTTADIDMVVSDRDAAVKLLQQVGFTPQGRHLFHEKLLVSIEIPSDMLEDADEEKITEIVTANGYSIFVIGIEDIILDRMRACVHWKSSSDCEWAYRMFLIHREQIDYAYLEAKAIHDQTHLLLQNWGQSRR